MKGKSAMTRGMTAAAFALLALALTPAMAQAADGGHGAKKTTAAAHARASAQAERARKTRGKMTARLPADIRKDYQKYCYNIADAARDARYARQKQRILEMEKRLKELMGRLDRKRREYEDWGMRRREITQRMTRSMMNVYAKMEPDAAAAQIAQMEYAVAVAILTGLKPQQASAILTEMDPKKAGKLVNAIVGVVAEATPEAARETN